MKAYALCMEAGAQLDAGLRELSNQKQDNLHFMVGLVVL